MSVYVDWLMKHGFRYGESCHLTADTEEELHEFAAKIGMRRQWCHRGSQVHYDLTKNKRAQAVKLGAFELTREDVLRRLAERRKIWRTGREKGEVG
ncbi:hypothetical protein LCGC14_1459210 [marine sediment metagenome]|uniref:DUF4031 domain-containing protein n=1 Tax=marine sediment metagenome TaxID=412755 RepID=A0A0F9K1N8_9ZZZZ